jgi:hypothetical protein
VVALPTLKASFANHDDCLIDLQVGGARLHAPGRAQEVAKLNRLR